jgi:hypothetical protein
MRIIATLGRPLALHGLSGLYPVGNQSPSSLVIADIARDRKTKTSPLMTLMTLICA